MTSAICPTDNVPTWNTIFLAQYIKCRTNPCTIALTFFKDITSGLYVSDIFGTMTIVIDFAESCLCLALVLMSMGFVKLRIVLNKSNQIRIDYEPIDVVIIFDLNILVHHQITLERTPRKRFGS